MSILVHAKSICEAACEAADTLFYPPHCANCKATTKRGAHLCQNCARLAKKIHSPFCHRCSQPFYGEIGGSFVCADCEARATHFDCAIACYRSVGIVREMIHRFKYNGEFHLRQPLADWLLAGFDDPRLSLTAIDALVPVPLHPVRFREREFNQALELAKIAGRRQKIAISDCIRRVRNTETQTHFDRETRMENLRNAFKLRKNTNITNQHLLLVDDVFTTGSTVNECARVLREAGAASVRAITVARA